MEIKTKEFLKFIESDLCRKGISIDSWKTYLEILPKIYKEDLSFRLLFDWHFDLKLNIGRSFFRPKGLNIEDPLFTAQVDLIEGIQSIHKKSYQIRELILYHARVDLRGKKVLEIGGINSNEIIFEHLGIEEYFNIESPDYIEADHNRTFFDQEEEHKKKKTFICNAEDIADIIEKESIDSIFSVACFEHILDLPGAINSCHNCLKFGGTLYAYFAPIYSHIDEGDHGVIPSHDLIKEKPIGFHLLSQRDQRQKLIEFGMTNPSEIQNFLGQVNFNRIPNRLLYSDYEKILTESPFWVLELNRIESFNISKLYPDQIKEIRESNRSVENISTKGFRTLLLKT